MTNQETFATRIAPAIPGLSAMSDLDAFRAIAQFCHMFCDIATTKIDMVEVRGGHADLAANMDRFEKNEGGVWCAGMAHMCAQMLNASDRVDKAWYLNEHIEVFSHATTLAQIGGVLYQYDPYLNGEYVDDQGEIMPYLDVLRAIKARKPPQWRQHFAEKDIHAKSMKDLRRWNDEIMTPVQFRLKLKTPGSTFGRGRGVFTARTFRMNYYRREIVDHELIELGYPAEPYDQLWHYLRLHPIAVGSSYYGDTDDTRDSVFRSIQAVVRAEDPNDPAADDECHE